MSSNLQRNFFSLRKNLQIFSWRPMVVCQPLFSGNKNKVKFYRDHDLYGTRLLNVPQCQCKMVVTCFQVSELLRSTFIVDDRSKMAHRFDQQACTNWKTLKKFISPTNEILHSSYSLLHGKLSIAYWPKQFSAKYIDYIYCDMNVSS